VLAANIGRKLGNGNGKITFEALRGGWTRFGGDPRGHFNGRQSSYQIASCVVDRQEPEPCVAGAASIAG
jgi:hypothetical protein